MRRRMAGFSLVTSGLGVCEQTVDSFPGPSALGPVTVPLHPSICPSWN